MEISTELSLRVTLFVALILFITIHGKKKTKILKYYKQKLTCWFIKAINQKEDKNGFYS